MTTNIPRPEYPRPDFERTRWFNLNGDWEFEFDDDNVGECEGWQKDRNFSGKIVVPFCFQSEESGINDTGMHEVFWYRKSFNLPEDFQGKRVLLNFGAVDYFAKVWINGLYAGSHKGGYAPFKLDVTGFLQEKENTVVVRVEDRYETIQPRGKQYWKNKPDRCWYTATSGIWQTVWLEAVGDVYIERLKMTPDIDQKNVLVELFFNKMQLDLEMSIEVGYKENCKKSPNSSVNKVTIDEKFFAARKFHFNVNTRIVRFTIDITEIDEIDEIHYWTPDDPNLYNIELGLYQGGEQLDLVKSYFGMRKISVKDDMILLNNRPFYQKLVLDQGYWPGSLLTPPSDEAIVYDIEMTKKMGFNGARKHQKMEDPRYYYWADRLGLLVWGEMPSAYGFNAEEIENVTEEWTDFIERDYNHPCIITWVPLNESWGVRNIYTDRRQQNFAASLYYLTKALDGTRLVSTNDGWEQVKSDICAIHDYIARGEDFTPKYFEKEKLLDTSAVGRMLYAEGSRYQGQPVLVTEYGGIAFESDNSENWGYNGAVKDEGSFLARYSSITSAIRNTKYICGYCYTQLTDVMQEINGLMTADRKLKVSLEEIRQVNSI